MPGAYFIDLYFANEYRDLDVVKEALRFHVEAADVFGTGQLCPAAVGPVCWGNKNRPRTSQPHKHSIYGSDPVASGK